MITLFAVLLVANALLAGLNIRLGRYSHAALSVLGVYICLFALGGLL